jgi:hypothetical protein
LNIAIAVCSIFFINIKNFFMRKSLLPTKLISIVFTVVFLFTSCKHDKPVIKQHFKISITTWYRVSPTAPSPVVVNGITYVSLANLVVGGDGTATAMGNIKSYANALAYTTDVEAPPAGSIAAPVYDIPGYPILGAPLPLIQAGDFDGVPAVIADFNVPSSVLGNVINIVLYNNKGDALFLSNVPGTGTSTPISPTVGGYTNETLILGGAGKFIHATGKLDNTGQFSFIAPYDGQDNYDGWIIY